MKSISSQAVTNLVKNTGDLSMITDSTNAVACYMSYIQPFLRFVSIQLCFRTTQGVKPALQNMIIWRPQSNSRTGLRRSLLHVDIQGLFRVTWKFA